MRGIGLASAAATVVNALPTGIGCALGLDLAATAEVDLTELPGPRGIVLDTPAESRTHLAEVAVARAAARFLGAPGASVRLTVRSRIPVARGLKSSSAVASAISLAVAHAVGADPSPLEVARLSAVIGREAGVSATGALDDALAGLRPGFVVTDNRNDTLLRAEPVAEELEAAVLVPAAHHAPSPEWARRFAAEADEGARVVEAARAGAFWAAMTRNTELVERVMGYARYASLRRDLARAGAVASGVSGLGPALVAIAPPACISEVLEVLASAEGDRFRVGLRSGPDGPAREGS